MSNPNEGNDQPASDQNTPEQRSPDPLEAIMALLTAIQQSANEDRTAMRQFMDVVTRRLANPLEPIESLCINLRNPTDSNATQIRSLNVAINPPPVSAADGSNFDHYWVSYLNKMPSGDLDRLLTHVTSRVNAANAGTSRTTGAQDMPGSFQVINQNRSENPDNAELQRLRQSELEQSKRIEELEDALKRSQTHQTQTTTPQLRNPARRPNNAQSPNESDEAESSNDAQRRAQQSNAAADLSANSPVDERTDEEIARDMQERGISQTELEEMITSGAGTHDRTSDEEDLSAQESNNQPVEGKGPVTDATTNDDSSQNVPKSRTPSAKDLSPNDDAPVADTEPPDTEPPDADDTATYVGQTRRKSARQIAFKAAEEERRKIKPEKLEKPRSTPWLDPRTGRPVRGYHNADSGPEEEKVLPPGSKPRKGTIKIAQPSTTSKTTSGTAAGTDQTTEDPETQAPMDPKQGNTGNDNNQNQGTTKRSKRASKVSELEAADALNEASESNNDSPGSVISDEIFEESFVDNPNPRPTDENEDEDDKCEEHNEDLEDGCQANNPDEAYTFSNRPKRIIKPGNSRQLSIGVGRRYGNSATSWVENPAKDSEDKPAKPSKKRKSTSPTAAEKPDDEDASRSPEKKHKPNKVKPDSAAGNGGKQNKNNFPPFNVPPSFQKKKK